jgi:hypothetical protein
VRTRLIPSSGRVRIGEPAPLGLYPPPRSNLSLSFCSDEAVMTHSVSTFELYCKIQPFEVSRGENCPVPPGRSVRFSSRFSSGFGCGERRPGPIIRTSQTGSETSVSPLQHLVISRSYLPLPLPTLLRPKPSSRRPQFSLISCQCG